MKDKMFQDVFSSFDPAALPTDIFLLTGQHDQVHNNFFVFRSAEQFFIVLCCVLQKMNQTHLIIFVRRGPQK